MNKYLAIYSQGARIEITAKSERSAKIQATKLLSYNNKCILYKVFKYEGWDTDCTELVAIKHFWSNGNRFGWEKWTK